MRVKEPAKGVISGFDFDQSGTGDPPGHVAAVLNGDRAVAGGVQQQCRHADRGQNVPDIDLHVGSRQRDREWPSATHATVSSVRDR